jgi:hypothetical protein
MKIITNLKVLLITIVVSMAVLSLSGCSTRGDIPSGLNHTGVERHIDPEAGVVCWTYNAHGISCLPISETTLPQ